MHVKIRRYQQHDFNDYVAVLAKTWPMTSEDSEETLTERLKTPCGKYEQIWAAEADDKAVGFMLIYFENPPTPPELGLKGEWLVIDWLDVHPDFQRQGLGTLLLNKAEEIAKGQNVFSLYTVTSVSNSTMLSFSQKNGYQTSKRIKDFWGKGTGDAFVLTKTLRRKS